MKKDEVLTLQIELKLNYGKSLWKEINELNSVVLHIELNFNVTDWVYKWIINRIESMELSYQNW